MATCTKPLITYTCSNSTGTTCTKVAATVYVMSTNSTCPAGELALLTPTEYATFLANQTALTSHASAITALQTTTGTQGTTLTTLNGTVSTQSGQITTLQTNTGGISGAITALQNDVALIKGGAASFMGIAGTPNPDVIQSQSVLFGAVMACAAVVWGMKKVIAQFSTSPTDD